MMKGLKRLFPVLLSLCVLATMMMPIYSTVTALGEKGKYYGWVLDTDGIEAGEEYLIVSGTAANSTALMRNGNNVAAQAVVVKDGNTIDMFDGDANCSFVFSKDASSTSGTKDITIKNGDRYLYISGSSITFNTSSQNFNVRYFSNGYYRMSASSRYVRYYSGRWSASTTNNDRANLCLYKKVGDPNPTYTVTYNSNGATDGEESMPQGETDLHNGDTHKVADAPVDLIKYDADKDDTYLFHCWNTAADGSGTDYMPGAELTMGNEDLVLYAKWYLEPKYTITVRCNVDGQPHDIPHNHGDDVTVYVSRDGVNYLPLTKTETGVYVTTVKKDETGDYYVYFGDDHEPAHEHMVVINNASGETTLQNFTVTYDKGYEGDPAEGDTDSRSEIHHGHTTVFVSEEIPVRAGYTFLGWKDAEGKSFSAGDKLTDNITAPIVLTAQWEKTTDVQVVVTIDHKAPTGGFNNTTDKHEISLQLMMQQDDGVYQPVGEPVILDDATCFDKNSNVTTYTYTFEDQPQGEYNVSALKSGYEEEQIMGDDGVIYLNYTYAPGNFDLHFTVKTDADAPAALRPVAVNIRVLYWGYDKDGNLGWHIITQHGDGTTPVTVTLDENGEGSGFYPVWKDWADEKLPDTDENLPYIYRLAVSSFVMPDGTVVPASSANWETYTPDGSGLYTAKLETEGIRPDYPAGSKDMTNLVGAYYDGTAQQQQGALTVLVDVHPYMVTFNAGLNGTINGGRILAMTQQYAYPNLDRYIPVYTGDDGKVFDGWYLDAACTIPATNQGGSYLSGNVTYYAKWRSPLELTGTVYVEGFYEQDGEIVSVHEQDRAKEAVVLLLKETAGAFNVVGTQTVTFGEYDDMASATYSFQIGDEHATYRVEVKELNYTTTYDNNVDGVYATDEYMVIPADGKATVDVHLDFAPQSYIQTVQVDATQISQDYRPTDALVKYMYRDLGSYGSWTVISQHTKAPYGVSVQQGSTGIGYSNYPVWNWHTNGTLYEYQAQVSLLYGHVPGVYEQDGTPYDAELPYMIQYGPSAWYTDMLDQQNTPMTVTLVPKQYEVVFDLGFKSTDVVSGMEHLVTAGPDGDYYAYRHTWSYAEQFIAFPYREGYVFKGWKSDNDGVLIRNNGEITVATGLMKKVTLTAQWEKIEGTACIVRHLEKNTNKVLHGSEVIPAGVGDVIKAVDQVKVIQGYNFESTTHMEMVVSSDNASNVMIIYYLPDGSDGYTEQVESNLHLDKTATLEDDGTYTVWMETFTTDNPVTTLIQQNTPLDIVLVLDQSGSMYSNWYWGSNWTQRRAVDDLRDAVSNFIDLIADHGRRNYVDHRIAMVGYGSNADTSSTGGGPVANANTGYWCNTGVFDSHGVFHNYPVQGFDYTLYNGNPDVDKNGKELQSYYTKSGDEYLLLSYHTEYRHLMDEAGARAALLRGQKVYGYVYDYEGVDGFVELTRNSSGLWLYGDKQLYSDDDFYTYHTDVWTHRSGTGPREIHAYGTGANYTPVDGHTGVYTRTEVKTANPDQSIYTDALVPVTTGQNGGGEVTPGLLTATNSIGANGKTYISYGMEMANSILEATEDTAEDRLRIVIVFTDGRPGDSSAFYEEESNRALEQSYITQNTYGAHVYTVGLYGNDMATNARVDQDDFMNGLSSNYPNAQSLDDVWKDVVYGPLYNTSCNLDNGGPYYIQVDGVYRELVKIETRPEGEVYDYVSWGYTDASGNRVDLTYTRKDEYLLNKPVITNSQWNGYDIYRHHGSGYEPAADTGYYTLAESSSQLTQYFADIMTAITTKIQVEIVLHEDTILRDIMNQGLVLTNGTVITAYKVAGDYNKNTGGIDWARDENGDYVLEYVAQVKMADNKLESNEKAIIQQKDNTYKEVPYIQVYNYGASNPTDPLGENYHPHTVDVTGYDFSDWYIDEEHPDGYMMVVQITRIEAMDNVEWSRSTQTNNDVSGLWLPADTFGERELLLPFDQPTTLFVERAYVLDYGKPFTLSDWYYDDVDGQLATPIHIDAAIQNGMNWFDTNKPNLTNQVDGYYGNTKYGNVMLQNGEVTYTPTTMLWDGVDEFYVFGNTWRKTVLAQDANQNGNLWSKVQVIPANSVYYEDSFITVEGANGQNGVDGFTFTGNWSTVFDDSADPDTNGEIPERLEQPPYGDVHGWIDAMVTEGKFADGSAHFTDEIGAKAQFTFTGSGVDVYTRTNNNSGVVVATLYRLGTYDEHGNYVNDWVFYDGQIMDNLAVSGDYYHIPTISFMGLPHGTYRVELIATAATVANRDDDGNWIGDGPIRQEYHIDGIRVYKPLAADVETQTSISAAYGKEVNSTFTEVRDILLDYGDFNADMEDSTDGTMGAVFIDWIRTWQGTGDDQPGVGVPTYEIGTFEAYGPKNEVYLTSGQALVLKVDPNNTYYVGLKSLDGTDTVANVSGITTADPVAIPIGHSIDLYYQITPVDGYIVIQNGANNDSVLSVTKLRTTNMKQVQENGGILPVTQGEVVDVMTTFSRRLMMNQAGSENEAGLALPVDPIMESFRQFLRTLFNDVRAWMHN